MMARCLVLFIHIVQFILHLRPSLDSYTEHYDILAFFYSLTSTSFHCTLASMPLATVTVYVYLCCTSICSCSVCQSHHATCCLGGPKKLDHFWKCITSIYDNVGRRSIYQNVQLLIGSKTDILNVAIFKYSLHKIRETVLHRKYQLIQAIKTGPLLTVCNSCIWWCRKVIHIPNSSALYLE